MTGPAEQEMRTPEADETAKALKQPTGEQDEDRRVEGKDLPPSARIPIDQVQRFADLKFRRAEAYRVRLEGIWSAALGDAADSMREREVFLSAMLRVSEDLANLMTDDEVVLPSEIKGSIQEVELETADWLSTDPSKGDIAEFLRSSIAPTIRRFERVREGTPELRVDIVARVVFALRGSPEASRLACDLYRYLQTQEERESGFYQTVLNLAVVVDAGGPDYVGESIFLYHSALDGLRMLGDTGRLNLDEERGNEASRQLVSTAAANLAMLIARRVRNLSRDSVVGAAATLRDLKTISAVTFAVPPFVTDPGLIVASLQFSTNRPEQFLASIMEMSSSAESWEFGNITTSRLEAAAAVAAFATGNALRAVDLFFNAGVSLRSESARADGEAKNRLAWARMLVNAMGLRLALAAGHTPHETLIDLDGVDCAVNFVGSFAEYKAGASQSAGNAVDVEPLARELVHLAKWPLLRGTGRRLDQDRLERAAATLGITVEERSSFPELGSLVDSTVDALRRAYLFRSVKQDDVIVDTADLVGRLYGSVLVTMDTQRLQAEVDQLVEERQDTRRTLTERYQLYASDGSGQVGQGPAVVAGAMTEADWQRVAVRLTNPLASVVGAIAEFPH